MILHNENSTEEIWRLGRHGGKPVFMERGTTVPVVVQALDPEHGKSLDRLGAVPQPVAALSCTADFDPYGKAPPCWTGPEEYDYSYLDESMDRTLSACPKSYLLISLSSCSPPWWDELNPQELQVWWDGTTRQSLDHGCLKNQVPSLASEVWRQSMKQNIELLVRHVESSSHGNRVIGYLVCYGTLGAWIHFGTTEGIPSDFSPPVTPCFRAWLTQRYKNDAAISQVWQRPVRLQEILPPEPGEMARVDPRGFRHPVEQRHLIDFNLFLTDLMAETLLAAAGAVKGACHGRRLFGACYGNFLDMLFFQDGLQRSGQLSLHRVLEDDRVDFLLAPPAHLCPGTREGPVFSSAPETSIRLHGKVLFHQVNPASETTRESLSYASRRGLGTWFEGEAREIPEIRSFTKSEQGAIALVLDDQSMFFIQREAPQLVNLLAYQALELARTGRPFDIILRRDLSAHMPYRLLLFPNLFYADQAVRDSLHGLLKAKRATALWIGIPGFVDEEPVFENIRRLVGMGVRKPDVPHTCVIRCGHITYGNAELHAHTPIIDDPQCEILGTYLDSGLPGLGKKEQEGWCSIYSGAPALSSELILQFDDFALAYQENASQS